MPVTSKYKILITALATLMAIGALAESYDSMWKKAQKSKAEKQYTRTRNLVNDIYARALRDGNSRQLARALFAYDALNVQLPEDSVISHALRLSEARRRERNSTEHVLLTHILGRLTDSDHLLALSVADTAFLQQQPLAECLPLIGEGTLYDIFTEYIDERSLPDSVFVGWEAPALEPAVAEAPRRSYDFSSATPPPAPVPAPSASGQSQAASGQSAPASGQSAALSVLGAALCAAHEPAAPQPAASPALPPPPSSGAYSAFVFTVPDGISRVCLVESASGTPVKRWTLKRDDGKGIIDDIPADGNGHIWQRPTQIHNYGGLYDWQLAPITTGEAQANTLNADDFHSGNAWGQVAIHDETQLKIDLESADPQSGKYSLTIRAPHRNLTLMRDITSGGRLIEQRQYAFSDFIHFTMAWKEAYGDEALVTFAYVFQGRLYEAQMKIARPQ